MSGGGGKSSSNPMNAPGSSWGGIGQMRPMSGAGPMGNSPQMGPPPMATVGQGMPYGAFSTPSGANPGNTNAIAPQLQGGQWNQIAQMLAGPSYASKPPTPAAPVGISPYGAQGPRVGIGGLFNGSLR